MQGHPNNVVCVKYSERQRLVYTVSSAFIKVLPKFRRSFPEKTVLQNMKFPSFSLFWGHFDLPEFASRSQGADPPPPHYA
jgi:hypothetical protein